MINRRYEVTTRPISGAMDLNSGKPDAKQAALSASFTLGASLIMALGVLGFAWSIPQSDFGQLTWRATNIAGLAASAFVTFFAARYAWSMGNITIVLWEDYLHRLRDWHQAELWAYTARDGVETTQAISVYELDPNVASHVLITALLIQYRLAHQHINGTVPWSVRGLEEQLMLSSNRSAILLGKLTGTKPERMSERLAELGLIANRKPGSAGDWIPTDYDEVFERVGNWSKLRNIPKANE